VCRGCYFFLCVVVLWVLRFVLLCDCVVGAQFLPCDCVEDAGMLDTPIFCVFLTTNMFTCMYICVCVYIRICEIENPQHNHTTNKFEHPQHNHTTNKLHSNTTTRPNTLDHHTTNTRANIWIPVCPAKSTKISIWASTMADTADAVLHWSKLTYAVCCSIVQCDVVWCRVRHWIAVRGSTLNCSRLTYTVCCSVLQRVAVRCSVAVCCSVLHCVAVPVADTAAVMSRESRHTSVHVSIFHVATRCTAL